ATLSGDWWSMESCLYILLNVIAASRIVRPQSFDLRRSMKRILLRTNGRRIKDQVKDVLSYGMPKNGSLSWRTIRRRQIFVCFCVAVVLTAIGRSASAQQRPLITEDPEVIGAGRLLFEGGIDGAHDVHYPLSGLEGNLWRVPTAGISVGISPIAELQIDGGPYNHLSITKRNPAPLSNLVTATGGSTP